MDITESAPSNVVASPGTQVELEQKNPDIVPEPRPVTSEQQYTESVQGSEVSPAADELVAAKDDVSDSKLDAQNGSSPTEGQDSETKASTSSGQTAVNSGSANHYVPPVKRFTAVNINKAFLQKNPALSSSATVNSSSSNNKQSGPIARPTPQSAPSHSRLVTTKLTATPLSSSPGAGWTRPNSVTPPAPSPGNASGQAKALPTLTTVGGHGPPQIAPGGKIIQPALQKQKVEGSGKPAWRNVQPGAATASPHNDFPTAAEAAQSRAMRNVEMKAASHAVEAQKQALSETADAFRGVHLDPNAHHWDDVEDDNDDFLGGVIEFGDGRQYKIQVSEGGAQDPSAEIPNLDAPVSKADRFVDDFDRSWPKAHGDQPHHHGHPVVDTAQPVGASLSETSSNAAHSPVSTRESHPSKLLFNERSNRMEPFSGRQQGIPPHGHPQIIARKTSQDSSSRFNNNRFERDAPPHVNMTHDESHVNHWTRNGPGSGHPNGFNDRHSRHEWNTGHRGASDHPQSARGPSSTRSVHETSSVASNEDVGGRHAAWGAPRQGHNREMPPHMAQQQSRSPVVEKRGLEHALERSPQNSRAHLLPTTSSVSQDTPHQHPPQPTGQPPTPAPSPEEIAALHKAFLADNAEKAKKRRQEEEAERIRAQERAKEKAAKLAALMEASKSAKPELSQAAKPNADELPSTNAQKATDAQVLSIIEDAVKSGAPAQTVSSGVWNKNAPENNRTMPRRLSSATSADHLSTSPTADTTSHRRLPTHAPSVSDRADTWRSAAKSTAPAAASETTKIDAKQTPSSALPDVRAFEFQAEECTEVVEFSEMGALSSSKEGGSTTTSKPVRPVASDFFTEPPTEQDSRQRDGPPKSYSAVASHQPEKAVSSTGEVVVALPGHNQSGLTPTAPKFMRMANASFREAPLSTLDDTMSRIKGALDVMHLSHNEAGPSDTSRNPIQSSAPPRQNKWLPPALRPQGADFKNRRTEDFTNTSSEPPMTPPPSDSKPTLRLPKACKRITPVPKRQFQGFKAFGGPVRWEILSFEPPVEGMTKRNLSVNDVLFRRPAVSYNKIRYRVYLPKRKQSPRQSSRNIQGSVKSADAGKEEQGAFGRPKISESTPWRSPEISNAPVLENEGKQTASALNVTSRSPPPDVPTKTSIANTNQSPVVRPELSSDKEFLGATGTPNSFAVENALDVVVDAKPSGVIGQLVRSPVSEVVVDSRSSKTPGGQSLPLPGSAVLSPLKRVSELAQEATNVDAGLQKLNPPVLGQPATPPSQLVSTSSWAKSPARAPDPEHLKAVWSQPSAKDPLPSVNSLKSIPDDLTAVPFTLHEVKSESGTPPPTSSSTGPPARMSASEVTRAFQMVPNAPANQAPTPNSRPAHLPPTTASPSMSHRSLKHQATGLPPPAVYPPAAGRNFYYPPSVNHHSPSPPTMVYPHVVPNGVTASPASPYAQPVWMPVMQPGQQMLRPQPSSPYSPQLIPYQTTGPQNGMMPAPPTNGMIPTPTGPPGSYGSPGPAQMMISPVMHHATPAQPMIYSNSPMMVHVSAPAAPPQQRPYAPGVVGMGRGMQPHMDSRTHTQMHPQHPHAHTHGHGMPPASGHGASQRYPVHSPGYNSAPPPQSFVPHQQW